MRVALRESVAVADCLRYHVRLWQMKLIVQVRVFPIWDPDTVYNIMAFSDWPILLLMTC